MLKRLVTYYKPYRKMMVLDLVFAFLLAAFDLFYPVITGNIIDEYIPHRQSRLLVVWLMILLGLYVLKAGAKYVVNYYGHVVGVRMQMDMRREVFAKLQDLPFSYFDNHKTGAIMSRIIGDLMDISELAHHGPEELFLSAVTLMGAFTILIGSSFPLTLLIFAFIPVIAAMGLYKKKKLRVAFSEMRKEIGWVNADLENSIAGIRVSRAFSGMQHQMERFGESHNRFRRSREYSYKVMADYMAITYLMSDFLYWVALAAAGFFAYQGQITSGALVEYILYITLLITSIKRLIDFAEMYEMGMSGFVRFIQLMDKQSEQEAPEAIDIGRVQGWIEFRNVSFAYAEGKQILQHIFLNITPGQKIAIVGPSGSGKTTLCHLVPRFYEICSGEISIDGYNIAQITLASLRRNVGIVQQDVFLFNGTIRENIAYGNFSASQEEIEQAARRAKIHDDILAQPQGYDTQVGERGIKLSGGQKQRIAIARIFLKNPPILILDEATSALDNITEMAIQQSLDELCAGRTTLVVAHRLSTIKGADKVVVLTANGIEEEGTHYELLKKDGIYAQLYKFQFAQEEEKDVKGI